MPKRKGPKLDGPFSVTTCERIAGLRINQREQEATVEDEKGVRKDRLDTWKSADTELETALDDAIAEYGREHDWPMETSQAIADARNRVQVASAEYEEAAAKVKKAQEKLNSIVSDLEELLDAAIAGEDLFEQDKAAPPATEEKPAKKKAPRKKADPPAQEAPPALKLANTADDDNVEGHPISAEEFAVSRRGANDLPWARTLFGKILREIEHPYVEEDVQAAIVNFAKYGINTFSELTAKLRELTREELAPCTSMKNAKTIDVMFNEDKDFMRFMVGTLGEMSGSVPDEQLDEDLHAIAHKCGASAIKRAFYDDPRIADMIERGKRAAGKKTATA